MDGCFTFLMLIVEHLVGAHHKKPKTALAASGFVYVEGCWPCSLLDAVYANSVQQLHGQQPSTYTKPEAVCAVLGS